MGIAPRLTLAAVTALTIAAPAWAESADAVKVLQVRGQLRGAIAPNASWGSVAPGTMVHAGDTLKTGEGAADLLLPSGAHFVMGASTLVRLQQFNGTVSPRVLTGRVRFSAAPSGTASLIAGDYLVAGANGEAIVSREGGNWQVAVLSGQFRVSDATHELAVVEAGKVLTTNGAAQPKLATLSRTMVQDLDQGLRLGEAPATVAAVPQAAAPVRTVAGAAGANRWVATGLSTLLPGAGQLYAGELPRGLAYLGLNGALLGVGYYARSSGQNNLATVMAVSLLGLNVISPLDALFFTPDQPEASKQ